MTVEDSAFWILLLTGAGIILWMVFAVPDIDMMAGIISSLLFLAGAQIMLWKKLTE